MIHICKKILQHVNEYCVQAAIHGPQHIVSERLSIFERVLWVFIFGFGCFYGYLLYTPILHDWYYNPTVHDMDNTDFYVKNIPFPAVTICSNNRIVNRQLQSVLLTQPWKGLAKRDPNFANDLRNSITALVTAQDSPNMLTELNKGSIRILNDFRDELPIILKKVMQTCEDMILECYWFGLRYRCTDLFDVRPTDFGFCCSFNTLPMSEQYVNAHELEVGQENLYEDPCDEWLDLINKKITSPNFPDPYDSLTFCRWNLTCDEGYYIELDFESIVFYGSNDGDYLTIYEIQRDGKPKLISNLTGSDNGPALMEKDPECCYQWWKKIISSSRNNMIVEFNSDYNLEERGFSAFIKYVKMPSNECNLWLDMEKRTIKSPNYPNTYGNNILCEWLITVEHGFHLTLQFTDFELENNNDHLTIYDGGSDQVQMIANLTGQMNETKISIFGNQMFVVFHTNEVVGKTGFRAIILQNDKCQYWLNKVDRTLTSTNHMNLNCTWFLAADEGFYVNLEISKVEIRLGEHISIYDGQNLQSTQIFKLDYNFGNMNKKTISSTEKYMTINFSTNKEDTWYFMAFKAYYNYIPINSMCNHWFNISNLLMSPISNSEIDCSWVITANSISSTISIQIEVLELGNDLLKVYDGGSDLDDELSSMTGNHTLTHLSSTGSQLFISLKSDGIGPEKDFSISLSFNDWCENALNLTSGKLIVNKDWPSGTYCQWLITSENNNSYVTLEFQHLNILYWDDRIDIYDGPNEQSKLISEIFGTSNNKLLKSISSSGKAMFIEFKKQLGKSVPLEFESSIKFNTLNSDCQNWLNNNELMSPNYPFEYYNNIDCNWLITSRFGSHLTLQFDSIELDQDYLKIYDGGSEYSDLIANITGVYGQTKVDVSKNQMYIMLEIHSSDSKKGFKAIIQEIGDSCQYWMDLHKMKITSPYYPQYYFTDGIGCEWLIKTTKGNIISLEFNNFELIDDRWYFLSLFDGVCDQTKELKILRGLMPEDNKWVISSSGHTMLVRFSIGLFLPNESPGFSAKIHFVNCANVTNGHIGYCSCNSCSDNEGDCESDDHCQNGLRCGINNCPASLGFDKNTDCCSNLIVGEDNFCSIQDPCRKYEGDCDSDDECQNDLFCGSNNCAEFLDVASTIDCCEPKGTCATNYCQDGIQVFYGTETQNYQYAQLYGHYELQPDNVNDRPHFKMDSYGIWWDGIDCWVLGLDVNKGMDIGFAFYKKNNAYCPHQFDAWGWEFYPINGESWLYQAGYDLGISCKHSSVQWVSQQRFDCITKGVGNFGNCSKINTCKEDEGDCDDDSDCNEHYKCGVDNCRESLGHHFQFDCCFSEYEDFCTLTNPCGIDEGDCDSHDVCQDGLFCGLNNCLESLGFDSEVDCCYRISLGAEDFCSVNQPCAINEGDCDSNDECQIGLICDTSQDCSIFDKSYDVHCCQTESLCSNMINVNRLANSVTNKLPEWVFDLEIGSWNFGGNIGSCGDSSWWGFREGNAIGSISIMLYGKGYASLTFGNCWKTGEVKLFLNDSVITSVGPNSIQTVEFYFEHSQFKLEEHHTGIIRFDHFEIPACSDSNRNLMNENSIPNNWRKNISEIRSQHHSVDKENIEKTMLPNQSNKKYSFQQLNQRRVFQRPDIFKLPHKGLKKKSVHSKNKKNQSELKKSYEANSKFGLTVVLNPDEAEYGKALKNSFTGFKTLVHTPYDFAEVDAIGMAIDKNIQTFIGIRGFHSWITDAANSLDMQQKRCLSRYDNITKYPDIKLDVFANYTRKGCILECHANLYFNECGCLPYHYPDFSLVWGKNTNCNFTGLKCLSTVKVINELCRCPSDCESTKYSFDVSVSPRSRNDTALLIKSYSKKNKLLYNVKRQIKNLDSICMKHEEKTKRIQEYQQLNHSIAHSCSVLHFFYTTDTMFSYKRDQRYTIWDMLAIFGGMMGCAIGMSVAAACEIIYWLTLKPLVKWMKMKKGNQLSPKYGNLYIIAFILVLLSLIAYSTDQFNNVYLASLNR